MTKHKALIIEDNEEVRILIAHLLRKKGIPAMEAGNAIDAMELIEKNNFTIIILDLILPKVEGFEIIKILKRNPEWEKIYILVVSALREQKHMIKALELGADDYLTKPVDPDVFFNKLKYLIKEIDIRALPVYPVNPNKDYAKIMLDFDLKIQEISEEGIKFVSNIIFNRGSMFVPEGDIFLVMDINPPRIIVEECEPIPETDHKRFFVSARWDDDLDDMTYGKIRKWILRKMYPEDENPNDETTPTGADPSS